MNEVEYKRQYDRLNKAQKEAVDAIEGPVMVIAGPGTGKTQILTLRIANIMRQTDLPRSAILALTFTNAAAANMRKRLVNIVGSDAYSVSIYTFHSFANDLIDRYPEQFGAIAGFTNVSEVEQLDILRGLLDGGGYELLAPLGDRYRNAYDIRTAIGQLKKEGYTPEGFAVWLSKERATFEARDDLYHTKGAHKGKLKGEHEKTKRALTKNAELARLFEGYQAALRARKRFDFDDSLLALIDALTKREHFLRELQEEYQYVLVDEHQDTNGAQNAILELLVSYFDRPNLFVVGDEKQAIFRFQGASLENFLYFEQKFSDVRRIRLDTSYRSYQSILDAAHSLIGHARETIPAELRAVQLPPGGNHEPIKVYTLGADDEEMLYLAESVEAKLKDGVLAHEIAVLFRTNRDAARVGDYFERLGIPFIIESGHGVLDDPDIQKLHRLIRALADLTNDDALVHVLFLDFFAIPLSDVYAAIGYARKEKVPLLEALRSKLPGASAGTELRDIHDRLLTWAKLAENVSFPRFFEDVVRTCGILDVIQRSPFHMEKFDKLVKLFDEIKAHTTRNHTFSLADYLNVLTILDEHGLTLEAKSRHVPNAVRLMTAHKSKGLEFDYVFIVGAYDGHWGNQRSRRAFRLPQGRSGAATSDDEQEDERRLFYVALTRARKQVYVSYAAQSADGRERVPTRFIEEIRPELMREHTAEDAGVAGKRPPLFVARSGRAGVEKYEEFVRAHFAEKGLSATGLNNYLACPWKWFYRNFFHVQFVPSLYQKRGTAVHAALQDLFNARNTDPAAGEVYVLERLAFHLAAQDFEPDEFERLLRDESEALRGYVRTYEASWTYPTVSELSVRGVLLDDVTLTGKIDKLVLLDEHRAVSVVDYKTGKQKSRNEMEGNTKAKGAGDYKRQLVFYKLLLDRFEHGKYHMKEGVIDFIEPNERGAYKLERFEIASDETELLAHDIRRVAQEIRTLAFWDARCADEECEECRMREMMAGE